MQNNFNFMFVENFIVNLWILLFVCKVRRLIVCVFVCACVPSRMNVQCYIKGSEKFFSV
jgi:hypothetical protein